MGRDERANPNGTEGKAVTMVQVFDMQGTRLALGDQLILLPGSPLAPLYNLVSVEPSLHPQAPAGALEVTLYSHIRVLVVPQAPQLSVFRVSAERVAAQAAGLDPDGSVPADPPSNLILTDAFDQKKASN